MPAIEPRPIAATDRRADQKLVRMRDGARLATDIYLPASGGPFPTILARTPYDKSHEELAFSQVASFFNEHGYAFVGQDTRGKGRSDGEIAAFVHDVADGYDTLEWLENQPWCDGSIATWGESYGGFTQWAVAASGHAALRAMVPLNTTSDIESWIYRQGVFELAFAAPWAARTFVEQRTLNIDSSHFDWTTRPLKDIVTNRLGRPCPSFDRWVAAPPGSAYWTDEIYRGGTLVNARALPALHIGGSWDCFRLGQMRDWSLSSTCGAGHQFLIMHATDHLGSVEPWATNPDGSFRDPNPYMANRAQVIDGILAEAIGFYDLVLKGRGDKRAKVRFELGGECYEKPSWPPGGSRPAVLHLGGQGRAGTLSFSGQKSAYWATWTHDPANLVPSTGGAPMMSVSLPADDRPAAQRPDVLTFQTASLQGPLDITGPVVADFVVGTTGPSLHVAVKLLDVSPSGGTRRIADGAALISSLNAAGEGRAVVEVGPVAYRLLPGHQLAVQISSSDFPRYLPLPGTGENPWSATRTEPNDQRLRIGGRLGARLLFSTSSRGDD